MCLVLRGAALHSVCVAVCVFCCQVGLYFKHVCLSPLPTADKESIYFVLQD